MKNTSNNDNNNNDNNNNNNVSYNMGEIKSITFQSRLYDTLSC